MDGVFLYLSSFILKHFEASTEIINDIEEVIIIYLSNDEFSIYSVPEKYLELFHTDLIKCLKQFELQAHPILAHVLQEYMEQIENQYMKIRYHIP